MLRLARSDQGRIKFWSQDPIHDVKVLLDSLSQTTKREDWLPKLLDMMSPGLQPKGIRRLAFKIGCLAVRDTDCKTVRIYELFALASGARVLGSRLFILHDPDLGTWHWF